MEGGNPLAALAVMAHRMISDYPLLFSFTNIFAEAGGSDILNNQGHAPLDSLVSDDYSLFHKIGRLEVT